MANRVAGPWMGRWLLLWWVFAALPAAPRASADWWVGLWLVACLGAGLLSLAGGWRSLAIAIIGGFFLVAGGVVLEGQTKTWSWSWAHLVGAGCVLIVSAVACLIGMRRS